MRGSKLLLTLTAVILGIHNIPAAALPASADVTSSTVSSGAAPSATAFKRRRTFNCNQNPTLKKIEAKAWADAGSMAEIAAQYDRDNQWQPAMNYWMGADSKDSNHFFKIQTVVDVYCGDTSPNGKVCGRTRNPINPSDDFPSAVGRLGRGLFWNTYEIVLCPRFFEEFYSLDFLLDQISHGNYPKNEATYYDHSWGHTIYHELSHLNPIIANFQTWDVTYGPCRAAKLANQNGCNPPKDHWVPEGWNSTQFGTPKTLINADSYARFASGVYFQKAFDLDTPAYAVDDCGIYKGSSSKSANASAFSVFIDVGNRTDGTYGLKEPPETLPENMPPDDPLTPNLPYTQAPLPSDLATPFPKGGASAYFATYKPSQPTFTTATQTSGSPTSTSASPPEASESVICNASYKFLFDQFTIEGKDFPADKLDKNGVHGDGLKEEIRGCGALTDWKFETLKNDPNGMKWKATGHLPIGTIACVGRAVESAGGNSKDKCTGTG